MPHVSQTNGVPAWHRRLRLPAYRLVDASKYSGAPTQTISYWYRQGENLAAALGSREPGAALSYLQLVEVAFVKTFRDAGVSLQRLRRAREFIAQRFATDFPFARFDFQTDGYHVFMELDEAEPELGLEKLYVAADSGAQTGWPLIVKQRFRQFDYVDLDGTSLAVIWHPSEAQPDVIIDARKSFGAPTVHGVPTWALAGRAVAGESLGEIAYDFDLDDNLVREALEFEGVKAVA